MTYVPPPPGIVPPPPPPKYTGVPDPPAPPEEVMEFIPDDNETLENREKRLQAEIDSFIHRCLMDYQYFAESCLKIKTKTQGIKPFIFNKAQEYLHAIAEKMIAKYGFVRIVIVKGRQQGLSTWVEGRGYWKTSQFEGVNAYILTHEQAATKNLFDMAKRYHDHCPPEMKPITKKSNAKELVFSDLESQYSVGTAKTGDTGRSQTIHFFHGSEVGYWQAAEEISSGAMQGVPDEPGTEIYMESTAKGAVGYFASLWRAACFPDDDDSDNMPEDWNGYWRVFVPWFWEPSYRREVPAKFIRNDEELKMVELYGLDDEQLAWRRRKIATMKNDVALFKRDYPANPAEAFNSSLHNVLISPETALTAMAAGRDNVFVGVGKIILGVDVAREGADDSTLVLRQGRVIPWYRRLKKQKTFEVAGAIVAACKQHHVDHVCIDATGGYGAGVYDVMVNWGLGHMVTSVGFGDAAIEDDRYKNRRAEMYWLFKEWLERGASIPNHEEWLTELSAITYKHDASSDRLLLERKDEIKKRIGKSTDITDGAALTFCMPTIVRAGSSDSFDPFDEYGVI